MSKLTLRSAEKSDAPRILEIYKPYIVETPITFEIDIPSVQEIESRIAQTMQTYPWLVIEEGEYLLGYAYAAPFRARQAYLWTAESSVYVSKRSQHRGLGRILYTALMQELGRQGFFNIIGGITIPNDASVGFHESLGFKKVAHLKNVGHKFGKWWDIGFWQYEIPRTGDPTPLLKPSKTHTVILPH